MEKPSQTTTYRYSSIFTDHQLGIVFALIGCLLFSLKPILVKLAYQHGADVTAIMTLRAASSLPVYLITLFWLARQSSNREKIKQSGIKAALIGVLGYYVASFLDITALEYISAQLERLLIFLFPSFVVLISWIAFGQKPSKTVVGATLLGYGGIALIISHDLKTFGSDVGVGALFAIGSALVFAIYLVASKPLIGQLGSSLFTSIGMGSAGVAILIHLLISDTDISNWSIELIGLGIFLGVFCTVLPSYFVAAAMARLSPTELSLSNNIGPAVTAVAAVLVLDEVFTIWHALGMILVIFSVVMINRTKN